MASLIGLTYDLRDDYLRDGFSPTDVAEFDSPGTIAVLEATIRELGYRTDRIGSVRALAARLVNGERWDMVFNIAEGLGGRCREGQVPSLLETYGVSYTFSDPLTCALTLDKALAKRLVADAGLRTSSFAVIRTPDDTEAVDLRYPLFVKPNAEGTGKGIDARAVASTPSELQAVCDDLLIQYDQPLLVEEFLPGREFTVGILGTGQCAWALGTMEIRIPGDAHAVYSFEAKEECEERVNYSRLAEGRLRNNVEALALAAYRVLDCRDAGRVDIRLDGDGTPCFLEVNPLPGLHPAHSDLPMIATQEGMSYPDLIGAIIEGAWDRNTTTHRRTAAVTPQEAITT